MKNTEKLSKAELLLEVRTARAEREKQARRDKAQQRYAKALAKKVFTRNNRTLACDVYQARIRSTIAEVERFLQGAGSLNMRLDHIVCTLHDMIMDIYEVETHSYTYDYSPKHNDRVPCHQYKFTTGFEYELSYETIKKVYMAYSKAINTWVVEPTLDDRFRATYIVSSVANDLDITYDMNKVGA